MNLSQTEVLTFVREWHDWMARDGKEPYPGYLPYIEQASVLKVLGGLVIFGLLALLYRIGYALHFFAFATYIARLRIKTDAWSFEPKQCGLNNAYCNLGVSYVKRGRIKEAVESLENAWRVYPCPHNTSFGLRMKLCKELKPYSEAAESIARYKQMNRAFVAQPGAQADGPAFGGPAA